jgi:hypothetical protein
VAIGDFNGDGIPDLVVADQGVFRQSNGGLRILPGNGDGTFQPAQDILTGQNVGDVVAGDFRGTGHLDLIVTTNTGVSELLGNGDGTFQNPILITPQAGKLAAGDFNHDGNLDLVVANSSVNVFLGNGDGTFQLSQTFDNTLVGGANGVLAADLRGNGTLDLVVSGGFGQTPVVALGNGDGTFQSPVALPGFGFTSGIAVADFTGDGTPDLVFGLALSQGVEVLQGNGDGSFQFRSAFITGANPFAVAAGDFNGDGLPDIVAANSFGASVGVLINNGASFGPGGGRAAPPPGGSGHGPAGAELLVPTQVQPMSAATPGSTAEAFPPVEQAVADALFGSHLGENAGFLLPSGLHRKGLVGDAAGLIDPFTDDLG